MNDKTGWVEGLFSNGRGRIPDTTVSANLVEEAEAQYPSTGAAQMKLE
jgi:hypothetical protein